MQVSLNKLNKMVEKLKKEFSKREFKSKFSIAVTVQQLGNKELIVEKYKEVLEGNSTYMEIQEDLSNLKEVLFDANQRSGVSKLLAEKELITKENKLFESLFPGTGLVLYPSSKELWEAVIKDAESYLAAQTPDQYGRKTDRVCIELLLMNPEEIRKEVQDNKVRVSQIEDELGKLNFNTIVEVSLSETSSKLLGLR